MAVNDAHWGKEQGTDQTSLYYMQFSGKFKGNPLFLSKFWAQGPLRVKTLLAPWPKSWIRPCVYTVADAAVVSLSPKALFTGFWVKQKCSPGQASDSRAQEHHGSESGESSGTEAVLQHNYTNNLIRVCVFVLTAALKSRWSLKEKQFFRFGFIVQQLQVRFCYFVRFSEQIKGSRLHSETLRFHITLM